MAHIDETILNEGEVVQTLTKPGERQAWRIVAGIIVGEYALQYQFSDTQWRYFQGIRNARAAMRRHYARNN